MVLPISLSISDVYRFSNLDESSRNCRKWSDNPKIFKHTESQPDRSKDHEVETPFPPPSSGCTPTAWRLSWPGQGQTKAETRLPKISLAFGHLFTPHLKFPVPYFWLFLIFGSVTNFLFSIFCKNTLDTFLTPVAFSLVITSIHTA